MSKRGWIILSVAGVTVAGLAGMSAGTVAYVHRARKAAAETARSAREAFDPYYGLVQYLRSVENRGSELDPEDEEA